jgi:hypothetical protein
MAENPVGGVKIPLRLALRGIRLGIARQNMPVFREKRDRTRLVKVKASQPFAPQKG